MQALPNDEPMDGVSNNIPSSSPSMIRKSSNSPFKPEALVTPRTHNPQQNAFGQYLTSVAVNNLTGSQSPAVLPLQSASNYQMLNSLSSSVPSGAINALTAGTSGNNSKSDGKGVNIQYLKHVVLKFMLSRESEVSGFIFHCVCLFVFFISSYCQWYQI